MRRMRVGLFVVLGCFAGASGTSYAGDVPGVLSIQDRIATVNRILTLRLERLLPRVMRETGFDMWLILCNEDNPDPVFGTLLPYHTWARRTQILVLYDPGPGKEIEHLNISVTDMKGLHKNAWGHKLLEPNRKPEDPKHEDPWACLARIIRERDPKTIGINEGEVQFAAGGLTVALKKKLLATIGEPYVSRLMSAEPLATRWLETLLDEELDVYGHVVALSHSLSARMMSNEAITPGVTTVDDLNNFYWQQAANLGLDVPAPPNCSIVGRMPEEKERYGKDDRIVRRGDVLQCDAGIRYLRYNTDIQELAYVLRLGENDAPESYKKALAEANRLQEIYASQFKAGLTGNQLLTNILAAARAQGIMKPTVYGHSIGYFLHEPGPAIGMIEEQVRVPGRGDVVLVDHSCFTAELTVSVPIPEWGGREFLVAPEQLVAFVGGKVHFIDGRQNEFHLVR